jgi:hypothetical protein
VGGPGIRVKTPWQFEAENSGSICDSSPIELSLVCGESDQAQEVEWQALLPRRVSRGSKNSPSC